MLGEWWKSNGEENAKSNGQLVYDGVYGIIRTATIMVLDPFHNHGVV